MIRAIIIDNEQLTGDKLAKMLIQSKLVEVKGIFRDYLKALECIKKSKVDAVFLETELPEINGIELAESIIKMDKKIAVIFVTLNSDYAVEAFRINALDYLLKPVSKARLKDTINRIVLEKNIPMESLDISTYSFGTFKVFIGENEVKFKTAKSVELFAFLIGCMGQEVSRDNIIDKLWQDFDGDKAITNFNTTLHNVKKALKEFGVDLPVLQLRGVYSVDTSKLKSDICRFKFITDSIKTVNSFTIDKLEDAVALYKGDYLCDCNYLWAESDRIGLKERFVRLILNMAKYYISQGNDSRAVELLKTGLTYEPLNSEINYMLLKSMLLFDDFVIASSYYELYKKKLKSEFGVEPDIKFKRLFSK